MPLDLIPLAQAVRELGVSRSTLYLAIKAGKLRRYERFGDKRTWLDRGELARLKKPRVKK